MKRQHKNYKPKCLKYALDKSEIDRINDMFRSHDKEVKQLARDIIINSKVVKYNKDLIKKKLGPKVLTNNLYYMCPLLRLISK